MARRRFGVTRHTPGSMHELMELPLTRAVVMSELVLLMWVLVVKR